MVFCESVSAKIRLKAANAVKNKRKIRSCDLVLSILIGDFLYRFSPWLLHKSCFSLVFFFYYYYIFPSFQDDTNSRREADHTKGFGSSQWRSHVTQTLFQWGEINNLFSEVCANFHFSRVLLNPAFVYLLFIPTCSLISRTFLLLACHFWGGTSYSLFLTFSIPLNKR